MLFWLFIIILSYLFFSLASFGDKLVLSHHLKPVYYIFYVGLLSLLVLLLIPFVGFYAISLKALLWVFLASLSFMGGLYFLYSAVEKFEVSRVTPIVGSFQPLIVLFLSWLFWGDQVFNTVHLVAFFILLIATFIISFEKKLKLTKGLLALSLSASLLVALNVVLLKVVFSHISFFQTIIWMGLVNFIVALFFNIRSGVIKELLNNKKEANSKKGLALVIATQSAGGVAGLLQNAAIFLAPASSLAIINALRGVQYVFLFLITLFFSSFYPKIFKENISKKVIIQKVASILLIVLGLAILVIY